jgi:hypothetical protein
LNHNVQFDNWQVVLIVTSQIVLYGVVAEHLLFGEDLQMFLAKTGGRCVLWQYFTAIVASAACLLLIRR